MELLCGGRGANCSRRTRTKAREHADRKRQSRRRICRFGDSGLYASVSPGAILVEIGAAGDTHEKAMKAAEVLAEAILALKDGAN